jgi:hypothetical protein
MATIYKRFEGTCVYCGTAVKLNATAAQRRQSATRDHFIPVSAGGSKGVVNQVLACRSCNCTKGGMDPRTIVQVWHRLDVEALRAFIRRLDDARDALDAAATQAKERGPSPDLSADIPRAVLPFGAPPAAYAQRQFLS